MARKSADAEGVRSVKAVYVKESRFEGSRRKFIYVRQPFNLIEYDWGNGERTTGLEPVLGFRTWGSNHRGLNEGRTAARTNFPEWEQYDDLLILDGYADLNQWPTLYRDGSTAK